MGFIFNNSKSGLMDNSIDLLQSDIQVMLVNLEYIPDPDVEFLSDIIQYEVEGSGYQRKVLVNKSIVQDDLQDRSMFRANNVSWIMADCGTLGGAIIFENTGDPTSSPLIGWYDSGFPYETIGEDFVLAWNSLGIIMITATGEVGITGPAMSTDNAIVRYDGNSGDTVQDSLVTITDLGQIEHLILDAGTFAIMMNQIQIRRGLSTDLPYLTPAQGEFLYTTDTQELRIGDGVTPGGLPTTDKRLVDGSTINGSLHKHYQLYTPPGPPGPVPSVVAVQVDASGRVGIGTTPETEFLELTGAIRLGPALGNNQGSIQWVVDAPGQSGDFLGYTGSTYGWVSLTTPKPGSIGNVELRPGQAWSVIGRSAGSPGPVADIVAGAESQVLRRKGGVLGFGVLTKAELPAATVYTDQNNTYGITTQDFRNATVLMSAPTVTRISLNPVNAQKRVTVLYGGNAEVDMISATTPANYSANGGMSLARRDWTGVGSGNDSNDLVGIHIGGWYHTSGAPIPVYIGSTSYAASATVMTITSAGLVGIGTQAPGAKLQIYGNTANTGLHISKPTPGGFGLHLGAPSGNWAGQNYHHIVVDDANVGATGHYGYYSSLSAGAGKWNFYIPGTAQNYFAGETGIGMGAQGGWKFSAAGPNWLGQTFVTQLGVNQWPPTNTLHVTGNSTLWGNVGVYINSPAYSLDVNGSFGVRAGAVFHSNTSTYGEAFFNIQTGFGVAPQSGYHIKTGGAACIFGGPIGVGNVAPGYTLHVNGNVGISSTLYAADSITTANSLYVTGYGYFNNPIYIQRSPDYSWGFMSQYRMWCGSDLHISGYTTLIGGATLGGSIYIPYALSVNMNFEGWSFQGGGNSMFKGSLYVTDSLGIRAWAPAQPLDVNGTACVRGWMAVGHTAPITTFDLNGNSYIRGIQGISGGPDGNWNCRNYGRERIDGYLEVGGGARFYGDSYEQNSFYIAGVCSIGHQAYYGWTLDVAGRILGRGDTQIDGSVGIGIPPYYEAYGFHCAHQAKFRSHMRVDGSVNVGGDIHCYGTPVASGITNWRDLWSANGMCYKAGNEHWTVWSTQLLKENIRPLAGALDKVIQLKPRFFGWIDSYRKGKEEFLPKEQAGFIAEEVQEVFPEWVKPGPDGLLTTTMAGSQAYFVSCIQELLERIKVLEARVL